MTDRGQQFAPGAQVPPPRSSPPPSPPPSSGRRPSDNAAFAALVDVELRAMDLTGNLMVLLTQIVGDGPTREADIREAAYRVHALQNMILAQAAARVYPDRYRLLGETLREQPKPGEVVAYIGRNPKTGEEFVYMPEEIVIVREAMS